MNGQIQSLLAKFYLYKNAVVMLHTKGASSVPFLLFKYLLA